eukprot:TRINITY_DN714_c0_g1_i3.p1 TRINITY_DN714_c0_g1~~TRINITY_DN714_c0_g1_i3.p1  ORF type:complete len:183 (-),score=37.11 TRINITY_DN714_c0_g1_i3:60-608(-)
MSLLTMKEAGKLPFGQLPVLETPSGVFLAQSAAIMRYVGRLAADDTLYPSTDLVLSALIDSIIDQEVDLFAGIGVYRYKGRFGFGHLTEEDFNKVRASLLNEVVPRHLNFFVRLLEKSSTGWIAGTEKPSIADFILVPRLEWLNNGSALDGEKDILEGDYAKLKELIAKFYALPEIQAYKAK